MRYVEIYWEKIGLFRTDDIGTYSDLEEKLKEIVDDSDSKILDKNGLYAIIADNNQILYIGETHEQTIGERLVGDHSSYEDIFNKLDFYEYIYIIAGEIIPVSGDDDMETLIKDAEACLIYKKQPEFNEKNKDTCKNEIQVKNTGCFNYTCTCYKTDSD